MSTTGKVYHTRRFSDSKLFELLEEHREMEAALNWANRIMRGNELEFHLADLCLSTLQKHLATLIRHIPMERKRQTYRGICPGCGQAVELERETDGIS